MKTQILIKDLHQKDKKEHQEEKAILELMMDMIQVIIKILCQLGEEEILVFKEIGEKEI